MNEPVKKPLSYDMLPAEFRTELEACSCQIDGYSLVITAPGWVSPDTLRAYIFLQQKRLELCGFICRGTFSISMDYKPTLTILPFARTVSKP